MGEESKLKYALEAISNQETGSEALEILSVIAYFAPEDIHVDILSKFANSVEELDSVVQFLLQHSIVYSNDDKSVINIEKSTQKVMQIIIEEQNASLQVLEKTIALCFMNGINSKNIRHAMSVWDHISSCEPLIDKFSPLPNFILNELTQQASYKEGEVFGWKALDSMNRTIGKDHPGTVIFKHNMGALLGLAGKYEKALEILLPLYNSKKGYSGQTAVREPLIFIAKQLVVLSRFDEALKIYEESLLLNQTVSQANDDLMLSAWHGYASVLCEMGKYRRAADISREILERRSQITDEEDSETLSLKSALAHVLIKDSKYSEALKILYTVFEGRSKLLGESHIDTLGSKRDIAFVFQLQGRLTEALTMFKETVKKYKDIFTDDHPETILIHANIGTVHEQRGEFQKALETYQHIHKVQSKRLGEKHIDTLKVKCHIATIFITLRRLDEALKTLDEAYEAYIEVLGPKHPDTVNLIRTLEAVKTLYLKANTETIFPAVWQGELKKVKSMIESGIDINAADMFRKTALHYAAHFEHVSIVKLLLEKGAIYNIQSGDGATPFQITDSTEIKHLLISVAKLIKDAKEGNFEHISMYIAEESGIVNAKDNDGSNALHWAVHNGHKDIVKLLLENGADATQVTNKGNTPLHIATSKGHREIIEILLENVESDDLNDFINARTTIGGVTSIHVAARNGSFEIVKSLLKHGAIYNLKNKQGKTPLQLSKNDNVTRLLNLSKELFQHAKNGNPKIISELQNMKYDEFISLTSLRNEKGNTLLQVITFNNHEDIARQFLEMINKQDETESWSSSEWSMDKLKTLKEAAKSHVQSSEIYLKKLQSMSRPSESEKNSSQTKTLKEGSYYLASAHKLVKAYKASTQGSINNKNIQSVHTLLVELEFDPKHMLVGYTDRGRKGQVECFLSKGQGTKYYKLLQSGSKKDVRLFIQMVERNVEIHVKMFLDSLDQKLKSVLSEKLFKAVENNNHEEIEDCIKDGAAINSKNTDGGTPLHYAVHNSDISIIDSLLKNGADVTQVTTKGNTPLHIATSKGHKEIVEVLLQNASSDKLKEFINAQTTRGGNASLHVAAKNGSEDIVKSLLKHGAIYNIENKEGKRPIDLSQDQNIINILKLTNELFQGAESGNFEIISKLQHMEPHEFSVLTNACDKQGNTLLQVARINKQKNIENKLLEMFKKQDQIQSWYNLKCKLTQFKNLKGSAERHIRFSGIYLPMLRAYAQPIDGKKNSFPWKTLKEGSYYLGNAHSLVEVYKKCMNGVIDNTDIQAVNDILIDLQFHPEYNSSGYTDEAYSGQAKCFVSKGQGKKYYEMLHSKLAKDVRLFVEMAERNIDASVNRFIESMQQEIQAILSEQLFKAIENNNHSEVEECIKEGVLVNIHNTDGGTPLHYAANNGNMSIINILLQHKADATQVTSRGNTPLHIAITKGHKEAVEILLQHASDNKLDGLINAQTPNGGTASLHVAAKNGSIDIVKSLLKHGAIYNVKNKKGEIPLDLSKDRDVTNLLKKVEQLFQDAKNGDFESVCKLQYTELDEFIALTNAKDKDGNRLLQVAINHEYENMTSDFLAYFRISDRIQCLSSPKCNLEKFSMLQEITELCVKTSQLYLLELKRMSEGYDLKKNPSSSWIILKNGSRYLANAYGLVKIHEWCTDGAIDDEDIQTVNNMLIALEFWPEAIKFYLDEIDDEQLGYIFLQEQDAEYYRLLESELEKDVRLFIEMVERNIGIPMKNSLESIKRKLQYVLPEKLFEAIENNDASEVEDRVKNGVDVNSKNTNGRTPLHYAVHNGNLAIVNILLKDGADVTQVTTRGNTPLHIATSKDLKEIVEVLLQHVRHDKSNNFINAQTIGGTTALHVAVKNGSWNIVIALLKHGAIYNKKNTEGKTPLDLSKDQNISNLLKLSSQLFEDARIGNPEIINKLQHMELDKFIAVANACNEHGNTLLQVAAANNHKNIVSKFTAMLRKPDKIRSWFSPKLSLDQIKQLKEAAELYIQCSASYFPMLRNSSQSNRSEKNSFPWATLKAGSCYLENVYKLVEVYKHYTHGSMDDRNIQTINCILVELEFDPKHITSGYTDEAFNGKVECFVSKGQGTKYYDLLHSDLKKDVRSFVEIVQSNIDVHVKRFLESINKQFQMVVSEILFEAVENNNNFEVKNCLRDELVVNLRNSDGRTPLHYAVINSNMGIINTLLKHGADVTQAANNGDTSLHVACSKGNKRIVEVLIQNTRHEKLNEFINAQMIVEGTPLHIAAKNGFFEVVESLLKYGAIYNIKNQEGRTPLDLSNDQNVINLLKLVQTLFEDAKSGNFKLIRKLKTQPFKFTAIMNTLNDRGQSLVEVVVSNKHQGLAAKLEMMIKTRTNSTGY